MIIDATDQIVGRMATQVAKKALLGEHIDIINSEKAVISGKKEMVLQRYKQRVTRGIPSKGPFFSLLPERFLKRIIRGMLPHKQEKGEKALKRIICHRGLPEKFKDQKTEPVKDASVSRLSTMDYISIGELCRLLGGE